MKGHTLFTVQAWVNTEHFLVDVFKLANPCDAEYFDEMAQQQLGELMEERE